MASSEKCPGTADIVVIGGGGAALIAAIRARELGAEVLLVSKKPPGLASCTAYAGGGFTAPVGGMERDEYLEAVSITGRKLNDTRLLKVIADESRRAFRKAGDWGVEFRKRRGGASVPNEIGKPLLGGTGLTLPLVRRARDLDITMYHPFTVTRILQTEPSGPASGVEGLGKNGEPQQIRARSVVLATGGAGRLYARTDNPTGIAGDGYSLALFAGARLRDMEFVQFHPLGSVRHGGANWFMRCTVLEHVRLTDGNGREFLPQLMEKWGLHTGRDLNRFARDRLSLAIERRRSSTGAVRLHLEEAGPSLRADPEIAHRAALLAGDRSDPWRPVEVAPVQHFLSGGVLIDEWGRTDIANLYAPGEVAGGVHGANRVGGHALTELLVFGLRAGEAAAKESRLGMPLPEDTRIPSPGRCSGIEIATTAHMTPAEPVEGSPSLLDLMQDNLGPMRRGKDIRSTLQALLDMAGTRTPAGDRGPLFTAVTIAGSALARRESRGCHWREDFPREDDLARVFAVQPHLSHEDDGTLGLKLHICPQPANTNTEPD